MQINRAYKTKLAPTRNQTNYFRQCGRVARTVFNWVLRDYIADYRAWHAEFTPAFQKLKESGLVPEGKLSPDHWASLTKAANDLGMALPIKPRANGRVERKKRLNAEKKTDPKLIKITKYPYIILQSAVDDFDAAMKRYADAKRSGLVSSKILEWLADPVKAARYKRRRAQKMEKGCIDDELDPVFPRFKRRDDDVSFRFTGDTVTFSPAGDLVKLPVIGWVKIAETHYINTTPDKQCDVTISQSGDNWYVSVSVVESKEQPELQPIALGASIGVVDLVATSTGAIYENPRAYKKFEDKKIRLQRELARRSHKDADGKLIRGANWKKTKAKLAKLERQIANVRKHHQHNATKRIADTLPSVIVVKDMEVQDLQQKGNRHVNRGIADAGMGEVRRQLEYKAAWNGTAVIGCKEAVAEVCSQCNQPTVTIDYSTKQMRCSSCGHTMRASINMAVNLSRKAA